LASQSWVWVRRRPISWQRAGLKALRKIIIYALLTVIVIFCVFPVLWIVKTSFESPQFIRNPHIQWVPLDFTLDNYHAVISNPRAMIKKSFLNSVFVSTTSTLFSLFITTLAGYAMSRYMFRGKFVFSMYLILINMIPGTLILVSMFVLLIRLRLVNSYWGLIAFYATKGIPLATWMLKGYFDSIPVVLEEQALLDGANRAQAIRHIILPLAMPGIAAVGLFIFMGNWNEFMAALTILQNPDLRTLPVQIINFMGFQRIEWGPIMAYSVIVGLPVAVVFLLVQSRMVSGLTAGFSK
jgi:ABC-type glycerol-3-phosphate transport system permease component